MTFPGENDSPPVRAPFYADSATTPSRCPEGPRDILIVIPANAESSALAIHSGERLGPSTRWL